MNAQEHITAIRHLMLQLNDEHKHTKSAIKANADALKHLVGTAEENLHALTQQVSDKLKQLEDVLHVD